MSDIDNKQGDNGNSVSFDIAPADPDQTQAGPASDPEQQENNDNGIKTINSFDPTDKKSGKTAGVDFDENRPKNYTGHKAVQIIGGIVSAAAIWLSLWFLSGKGGVLGWIWVIVFGIVFLGKRQLEKKKNVYYRIFTLSMLYGLIGVMVVTIGLTLLLAPDKLSFFKKAA